VTVTTTRNYTRADGTAVVETTTRRERRAPDGAMLRWLLSKRFPDEFSDRLELTGAGGGPVQVEHGDRDAAADLADSLEMWLAAQVAAEKDERNRARRERAKAKGDADVG
jgi:hypothetical protein